MAILPLRLSRASKGHAEEKGHPPEYGQLPSLMGGSPPYSLHTSNPNALMLPVTSLPPQSYVDLHLDFNRAATYYAQRYHDHLTISGGATTMMRIT